MKKLSKRSDISRKFESFRRHAWLLFQSSLFAIFVTVLWYEARKYGIQFSKDDEACLVGTVAILAVPYSITAGFIFVRVDERFEKIVLSVLKKDMTTFLYYRDERIPIVLYLLIGAFSLPILIMTCGLYYDHVWAGVACVFSVSFALIFYWRVIVILQNPLKSPWLAERIPDKWFVIDIDEQFGLGQDPDE